MYKRTQEPRGKGHPGTNDSLQKKTKNLGSRGLAGKVKSREEIEKNLENLPRGRRAMSRKKNAQKRTFKGGNATTQNNVLKMHAYTT